jgi:hypothetical protein
MNTKQLRPNDLEQTSYPKTRGGPPPLQSKSHPQLMFCPKCCERVDSDAGYGLAYGGMGSYWICDQDKCDWFYKIMDGVE